jgi:3-phosphoinositide dependent protein kinase-1
VNIIEYFNANNIIHRDIKPENLVIHNSYQLKLVDFSTATFKGKIMDEDSFIFVDEKKYLQHSNTNLEEVFEDEDYFNIYKKQHFVGTAEYMAPEVIQMKEIGTYTDLWSFGCIIFQMFMGHSPFTDKTQYLIFQNILNLKYKIDPNLVPEDAYDLIKKLLKLDPKERLGSGLTPDNTIEKLKNHKFFSNFNAKKYMTILESRIGEHKEIIHESPFTASDKEIKKISQSEKFEDHTEHKEKILKQGTLKKKSPWLYYDKRKLILYNTPRVDYLDPDSNLLKGSIPLTKECKAELIDSIKFELKTPNRDFTFMCKPKYDITPWVISINEAIQQYAKP